MSHRIVRGEGGDHLGTVRQWRFATKNSARAIEYDPYGNIYGQNGFVNMPRIFALHEFDSALKQYRALFRHYRPAMALSSPHSLVQSL